MSTENLHTKDWGTIADRVFSFLDEYDDYVVCGHPYPDGDSIGCTLAVCELLRDRGKTSQGVLFSPLPRRFHFLSGTPRLAVLPDGVPEKPGALVCLDIGSKRRITPLLDLLPSSLPILNIDHHVSNVDFGTLNWTTDAVSSVGEMLYVILSARNVPITPSLAEALYVAILTDTGRLCYRNTRPETLEACARLLRHGVDCANVFRNLFEDSSRQRLHLLSRALNTLGTALDDRVSWMSVTRDMYDNTETDFEDTYEFIDIVKSVTGTKVALLFRDANGATDPSARTSCATPSAAADTAAPPVPSSTALSIPSGNR
jgi:phosphoesterase RecJ-like protein